MKQPIPVILDTDIGTDIDDAWALALLLRSPEVDLKLIVTSGGDPLYRARIIAGMLLAADRTDIPIGLGATSTGKSADESVKEYAASIDPTRYPGVILPDGVGAMRRVLENSPEPVTLLAIAPLTNIGELLRHTPQATRRLDLIGMHGSFHLRDCSSKPLAEWNIKMNIPAARQVFAAHWHSATVVPLDCCNTAVLSGAPYRQLRLSADPVLQSLFRQYAQWHGFVRAPWDWNARSSILYDVVAAWMVFARDCWRFERHGIRVTDAGETVADETAPPVDVALEWRDREVWFDALAARLLHSRSVRTPQPENFICNR